MTVTELLARYDEALAAYTKAYWSEVEDVNREDPHDVFGARCRLEEAIAALKLHFTGQYDKLTAIAAYTDPNSKVTEREAAHQQLLL